MENLPAISTTSITEFIRLTSFRALGCYQPGSTMWDVAYISRSLHPLTSVHPLKTSLPNSLHPPHLPVSSLFSILYPPRG